MSEQEIASCFPTLEPQLIQELSANAIYKTIPEGEVLVRTGQNIRAAILVLDGLVKVYREDDEGNEFFIYYLDAGKACAISLVCALGQETSGLMAKAVTESAVLFVPLQFVNQWMGKYRSWTQFAINSYRERFEELLETVDHIAFRNMDERLVFYLKRHQEKTKSNIITTSITEIAKDLGSSREVISRLMRKLSELGIVSLQRSHIEIKNLDKALV